MGNQPERFVKLFLNLFQKKYSMLPYFRTLFIKTAITFLKIKQRNGLKFTHKLASTCGTLDVKFHCLKLFAFIVILDEFIELDAFISGRSLRGAVNSCLVDNPLLRTNCRGLTENDSRYYGLSLFRTHNDVPKVSAIRRVDCKYSFFLGNISSRVAKYTS